MHALLFNHFRYLIIVLLSLFSASRAGDPLGLFEPNGIICVGPLPNWENAFPPPLMRSSYRNMQQLCVGSLAPWPPSLNGYCHLSGVPAFKRADRIYFGLYTNQYARALRWFCYARCSCKGKPLRFENGKLATRVRVDNKLTIDISNDQVVQIWNSDSTEADPSVMDDQGGSNSGSDTQHGTGSEGYSVEERIITLAPFTPAASNVPIQHRPQLSGYSNLNVPPRISTGAEAEDFSEASSSSSPPLQVCGAECHGPEDCDPNEASSSTAPPCRCIAKLRKESLQASVKSVMWLVTVCMIVNTHAGSVAARLNSRDLNGADDWSCACNATYVSEACCETSNGLVWEDPGLKRGILSLGF